MIERSVHAITEKLVLNKNIPEEEREVYCYGIRQMFDSIINILTVIAIGVLFGMVWQSILFSVTYIPLRRCAGGYHAPNPHICYGLSVALIIVSLVLIKAIDISGRTLLAILTISLFLIVIKAPVESRNKPLSDKEKAVYRRWSCIIAAIESITTITMFAMGWEIACKCILIALFMSAFLLLFSDKNYEKV